MTVQQSSRAVAASFVVAVLGLGFASCSSSAPPEGDLAGLTVEELESQKLREEITALRTNQERSSGVDASLLAWVPGLTALAAIAAVAATFWKQSSDLRVAREQARADGEAALLAVAASQEQLLAERSRDAALREEESLRRFDANLGTAIANLGKGDVTYQVNAAAALGIYLRPRYASFHCDLLSVVCANLRLSPPPEVARELATDLSRALRLISSNVDAYADDLPRQVDLARGALARVDLGGLDLSWTVLDVAFADMSQARFEGATLTRIRGREVNLMGAHGSRADLREARLDGSKCRGVILHRANLVSASFKTADLRDAQFHEASLQEAHFEASDLRGANFTGADVANAYFQGARFDDAALRTIARGARRWRGNSHFDEPALAAIARLSEH